MRSTFLLLSLSAIACSSSSAPVPLGPLGGAIVAGQNQKVTAGTEWLPSGVVEQIVRMPLTGALVMRRQHPWKRAFLPRLAYAQTVVKGSPVPGAVVCVFEGDTKLTPSYRCTNTGDDGTATFFFSPSTEAGDWIARINGSVTKDGKVEATTFDTAKATVLPDVFAHSPLQDGALYLNRRTPATFAPGLAIDKYGNAVPYRLALAADGYAEVGGKLSSGLKVYGHSVSDTLGTETARTIVIDSIVGAETINGQPISRVCGEAQIVTAGGVSYRGMYRTQRHGDPGGGWAFDLLPGADFAKLTSCSP